MINKELNNTEKTKTITKPVFKPIDITLANKKAKIAVKKETKKNTRFKTTELKKKEILENVNLITIKEDTNIETSENSIQRYINECHPDIRTFIKTNEIKKVNANCAELTIVTKNNFRVHIKTISDYERKVLITDNKRKVLFNNKTKVNFVKQAV